GYPEDQAAAIAYSKAGRSKKAKDTQESGTSAGVKKGWEHRQHNTGAALDASHKLLTGHAHVQGTHHPSIAYSHAYKASNAGDSHEAASHHEEAAHWHE